MACAHKNKAPIASWVWPRKKVKGHIPTVIRDVYELYHCNSCGGVAVWSHNDYSFNRSPLRGELLYSFERTTRAVGRRNR